jgi:hypothetical protein
MMANPATGISPAAHSNAGLDFLVLLSGAFRLAASRE